MYNISIFLFVKEGKEEVFLNYESLVLPLLERHNGKLLYRIRPLKDQYINAPDEYPYEIHLVTFNSKNDFEKYKNDGERMKHAPLFRDSVLRVLMVADCG